MFEILTSAPRNGTPPVYVTIIQGIGGWNSAVFGWSLLDDGHKMKDGSDGFYEPLNTGFTNTSLGTRKREDAVKEARMWAQIEEDLPLWIPSDKEKG
jgi:hypothetical protein